MRWAFWRRRRKSQQSTWAGDPAAGPGPDVGLKGARFDEPRIAPARPHPDEPDSDGPPRRTNPFSGAAPDAALHGAPSQGTTSAPGEPAVLDEAVLAASGALVADVVRALLSDDRDAARVARGPAQDPARLRAAAAAAVGVLATRLPALSGVEGPVVFDEDKGDLLHAYADVLAGRAEHRRTRVAPEVSRDQLVAVGHLAAAAALGDADDAPALLVLGGVSAEVQLLAGCVLLAQTCADGGGTADGLAGEVTALFA